MSLLCSLSLSFFLLTHYLTHSHGLLSFARFFPFSRFLFFHQINIIIMNPRYEYVAPFYFCLPHLTYFFFYLSKCNRDLYKNVHLLHLIVTIFVI